MHVSPDNVKVVAAEEWQQVAKRKERIAAQAERAATKAAEQLNDALDKQKLPPNLLIPAFGVSVDKLLALRGDLPPALHLHAYQDVDIQALWRRLRELEAKQAKALESSPAPGEQSQK